MPVIVEKSVCKDCDGLSTCQRLKRLNPGSTIRDEMTKMYEGTYTVNGSNDLLYKKPGRPKETFEIIIINCSMKAQNEIRKKRGILDHDEKEDNTLYYCNICLSMHRLSSDIGISHKEESDMINSKKVDNVK